MTLTVESPIFLRKLKIIPTSNALAADDDAWNACENGKNKREQNCATTTEKNCDLNGAEQTETLLTLTNCDKQQIGNKLLNKNEKLYQLSSSKCCAQSNIQPTKIKIYDFPIINKKHSNSKVEFLLNCCPWKVPWVLVTSSLVQILIYVCSTLNANVEQNLIYSPIKKSEVWRFFTYNYLHSDAAHLCFNVVIQILVALPLETEQGYLKVFTIYVGGVILGAFGSSVFQPTLSLVGGSAGVYSLLISHVPHIAMNCDVLSWPYFRMASVIVLCTSDILYTTYHCLSHSKPKISISAHASGAVAGLLIGFILYSGDRISLIIRAIRYLSIICLTIIVLGAVLFNIYVS